MTRRAATHAGSWYTDDGKELARQLDGWLRQVPSPTAGIGAVSSQLGPLQLPSTGARAIIAPHAGYSYSGPAAAWAYKALDLSNAKRIFLLGPSHHAYLSGCALSRCTSLETPLGDLRVDAETVAALHATGQFEWMSTGVDEAEHSLEMHMPYIYKMLSDTFGPDPTTFPPITPILVGATNHSTERRYGALLAPHLRDPTTVFIASSDFCHWGTRFRYTRYLPSLPAASATPGTIAASSLTDLSARNPRPRSGPRIHESIAALDAACLDAVESGSHAAFARALEETGNTVCGRHPIGLLMAAAEVLGAGEAGGEGGAGKGRFRFVRYERSSDCETVRDSSVSYCSAFAVF